MQCYQRLARMLSLQQTLCEQIPKLKFDPLLLDEIFKDLEIDENDPAGDLTSHLNSDVLKKINNGSYQKNISQ